MTARYIIGDTREVTRSLPDNSVDLLLTSPPFLALRSYLPEGHPDKALEIGSEATPADFLDVLLDLTEEWARVLAPHGSIVVELGDTYSGSGGAGGDYNPDGERAGQPKFKAKYDPEYVRADGKANIGGLAFAAKNRTPSGGSWPMDKSLCGIPHLYHLSLAYGRNLLRPERTTDPWRIRNVVAWCRPNPPVGALGDKFRPGTSYMTVACKARDRWFDLDAVRVVNNPDRMSERGARRAGDKGVGVSTNFAGGEGGGEWHPAGAPPLDWWQVPTEPYAGSHYATWPRKLLTRPILAMCPERVCTTCGEPSRRITGEPEYVNNSGRPARMDMNQERVAEGVRQFKGSGDNSAHRIAPTLGWSDCGHGTWRAGLVLDPFAGSGTTLAVATGHGRDAIGCDIDERNADLALERVGPLLLTVEHFTKGAAA
jgi:hypothetical protein